MQKKTIYLILIIFLSLDAYSLDFSSNKKWLHLLRYNKTFFGGYESEIRNLSFFFAGKSGRKSPHLELAATVKALEGKRTKDINQHAICRFPARAIFLKEKLNLNLKVKFKECLSYQKFLKKVNLDKVYLVFSSYYVDRPSSAFGHSLFRLKNKKSNGKGARLLDYGVNYAANVDTLNPFLYGVKGLMGGFTGMYAMMPYFLKIREYNDMESRDLWEYELNFNEKQKTFFMAHLWEMDSAAFTYYYLTKNCSYQIIRSIDTVNPEWNIMDKLGYFVIPVDTIMALDKVKGLVNKKIFQPSQRRKTERRYDVLSTNEKSYFWDYLENKKENKLTEKERVKVLDALIDYTDFSFSKTLLLAKNTDSSQEIDFKRNLLIKRSKIKIESEELKFNDYASFAPESGHPSRKLSLGFGKIKNENFYSIGLRFSLHNFLDIDKGYNPYTNLVLGEVELKYLEERKKVSIEKLDLVDVVSLRKFNKLEKKMSWIFRLGLKDQLDSYKLEKAPYVEMGAGISFISGPFYGGIFGSGEVSYDDDYNFKDFRFDFGPKFLTVLNVGDFLKVLNELYYFKNTGNKLNWYWANRVSAQINVNKNNSIGLKYYYKNKGNKVSVHYSFYAF